MTADAITMPTVRERRRARKLAVWNGAVWSIGNGLVSSTLIIYWAREIGAVWIGLGIGLLAAVPRIVGLLQLAAPAMIGRLADRKRFCIAAYLLSALVPAAIPALCRPDPFRSPGRSLVILIVLWSLHQLLQYLGTVALWSWLADAARARIRGRFLGWRQRWVIAGTAAAVILAGMATANARDPNQFMREINRPLPTWGYYIFPLALGVFFQLAALAPLRLMPACQTRRSAPRGNSANGRSAVGWTAPFRDRRFLGLLLFGCWFSFFNGITQAAQNYYPMQVLGVTLFISLALQTGMNAGQWAISPWMGRLADRLGNRPVMFVSQLLVAAGLLFFTVATPEHWQWLIGAWVLWIAYAGLNVCLPNLILKLAPPQANASYVAAYYAVTGLCFAANTILGGLLVDYCRTWTFPIVGSFYLRFFTFVFIAGWLLRSLGAFLLIWVVEPPKR
jgi:MFS family permease